MQGAATILHHPIHPMVIVFPIGFFIGSLGADIIFLASRKEFWRKCALALIGFGIVGGLVAAIFGLVDYRTAPMTAKAFDIAGDHMTANLVVVGIFVVNFILRWRRPSHWFGYLLTLAGFVIVLYSGWLGGELVYRHEVGVAPVNKAAITGTQEHPKPKAQIRLLSPRSPIGS